jgi:molybdopterin converting factor small subunit
MITVKLYGLLRLDSGIRELQLDASTVNDVFALLLKETDRITKQDLNGCVIMINGKQGSKRSKLISGDQVVLLSPVAGG